MKNKHCTYAKENHFCTVRDNCPLGNPRGTRTIKSKQPPTPRTVV